MNHLQTLLHIFVEIIYMRESSTCHIKKSLKIPKGQSESVNRRGTDNTIAKRKIAKEQISIYKTYT